MYFISDSYVLSAYHKTATISGKDEGYSIIDYKVKPLSLIRENLNNVEDLIFENKEERDSFKKIKCHEGFTTADGRIRAYVYFKEKPDINYKKSMYELLEQAGADPEAFAWKDLTRVCAVVVTPDQLKEIASSNLVDQILLSYGGDREAGGFGGVALS